jgi:DNA-binding response OmpR family regulator
MMLDNAGYDSEVARTATQARALAATKSYTAMTVDLKLPDQDGIALIGALREEALTRDLPIVVVSAYAEEGRVQINSESLSVSDWLEKPIDANRLVLAIRHAIERGSRDRPRVLHVEGDLDIQHISAAIARDFATFEFAGTLHEARARLRLRKYDLILLALNLAEGEGSGWELVSDIEALDSPPPIVVFTARDVSRAESRRVAAVLMKAHTSSEELLETIQRVLRCGPRAPVQSIGEPIAQAA